MTDLRSLERIDVSSVLTEPHDRAVSALAAGEAGATEAVAWCSAHLAAVDQVLHAAVRHHLPDGRQRVQALRAVDHRLQQAVCRLDRRLTGDVHLAGQSLADVAAEVHDRLREHVVLERRTVDELMTRLTSDEQLDLARELTNALVDAPTRPHPHTRHTPMAGAVAHLDAGIDRVRDVLDNRHTSTPHREHRTRTPGRWGSYLMAAPFPRDDDTSR